MTRGARFAIIIASLHGESRIALRISILASGSSGNATLLETARTRLLIDAGLGKKETLSRLGALGVSVDRLDGVLISHEHTDHCNGMAQLSRHWKAPVFITEQTLEAIRRCLPEQKSKKLERIEPIAAGRRYQIGDIEVNAFAIPHDAAEPVGFSFRTNGTKFALVTDLGYLPELVKHHLRDCDCLMLESNHDVDMLKVGPYPWYLKQRVMSRTGHLSNHAVSEFLADEDGFDGRARYLVLAHLSENNNNPAVARISAEEALMRRPLHARFTGELLLASQNVPIGPLEL